MAKLLFLTRRGCHLCEDALALLAGIPLEVIDIDLDPDLLLLYDERVPVLIDPETRDVVAEGMIDEEDVGRLRR
jgi:glutaredoxin